MDKIRIVASGLIYPVTMMRLFTDTMRDMENIDLTICGPFYGNWIPWDNGITLPNKYVQIPEIPLPTGMNRINPGIVEVKLKEKPDLWIQFDAGFHFTRRPNAEIMVTIGTDTHCLNDWYEEPRKYSDHFFSMQLVYAKPGDIYLPYAYSPKHHSPLYATEKVYDGCLIGLHYAQRDELVNHLRNKGYNILYSLGESYREFQLFYSQSKIALNWSSLDDLNARTFEAMGMDVPLLTNRVTDLSNFFVEDEHFIGFSDVREAGERFEWMINHPDEVRNISEQAHRKVEAGHTYRHRIDQILSVCKLI